MEYFVYIIRSLSSGKYYTGITNNILRRLDEHNGTHSSVLVTKNIHDFELVYVEIVDSRIEARNMEKYLKSGVGREIREEIVKYIL